MEAKMKVYRDRKPIFLAKPENVYCPVWDAYGPGIARKRTEDVHHTRGRAGELLLDERFWLAVSRMGHDWIQKNPDKARAKGWLCERGQWNKPVPK